MIKIYQEKQLEVIRSKTWINGRNFILEISKSKEITKIIDTLNKDEKQMANIFIKNIVPTDIAMVYGILEKNLKY